MLHLQYGFLRHRTTGKVDTDTVYQNGRYAIGPAKEFKVFPADMQIVKLDELAVASKDSISVRIRSTCT